LIPVLFALTSRSGPVILHKVRPTERIRFVPDISKGYSQMKFGRFVLLLSSFLIGAFAIACPAAASETSLLPVQASNAGNPAEEVKSTIRKMIALIDQGKTLELLEEFTDVPAENRERIASRIDQEKLDEMKKYLGMATKMIPKVSDDGQTVIFENDDFPRTMKFVKTADKWLMKDK
jgi:hypothetical protein